MDCEWWRCNALNSCHVWGPHRCFWGPPSRFEHACSRSSLQKYIQCLKWRVLAWPLTSLFKLSTIPLQSHQFKGFTTQFEMNPINHPRKVHKSLCKIHEKHTKFKMADFQVETNENQKKYVINECAYQISWIIEQLCPNWGLPNIRGRCRARRTHWNQSLYVLS